MQFIIQIHSQLKYSHLIVIFWNCLWCEYLFYSSFSTAIRHASNIVFYFKHYIHERKLNKKYFSFVLISQDKVFLTSLKSSLGWMLIFKIIPIISQYMDILLFSQFFVSAQCARIVALYAFYRHGRKSHRFAPDQNSRPIKQRQRIERILSLSPKNQKVKPMQPLSMYLHTQNKMEENHEFIKSLAQCQHE